MIGHIYKITNKLNNKSYIGQTIQRVEDRWNQHYWKATHQNADNMAIKLALRKYGRQSFDFSVIEECEEQDLDKREIYWINFYNTYHNGYNLTKGGNGVKRDSEYECFSKDIIDLYNIGFSLRSIAKEFNIDKQTVKTLLLKHNVSLRKTRTYKLSEINRINLINDYDSGVSRRELMLKYNIKSKGYLSTILNKYRIKYFQECSVPDSTGIKCTPNCKNDKFTETKDKELL